MTDTQALGAGRNTSQKHQVHARVLRPKRKLKKHGASTINEGRKSSDRCAGIASTGTVYTASQVAAENLNAGGKSNDRCPGTTTVDEGRKSSDRCAGITPTENVYTVPHAVVENLDSGASQVTAALVPDANLSSTRVIEAPSNALALAAPAPGDLTAVNVNLGLTNQGLAQEVPMLTEGELTPMRERYIVVEGDEPLDNVEVANAQLPALKAIVD